ncbi:MAG: hypothetical protein WCB19_09525 [Thermoplasmata archaeon]
MEIAAGRPSPAWVDDPALADVRRHWIRIIAAFLIAGAAVTTGAVLYILYNASKEYGGSPLLSTYELGIGGAIFVWCMVAGGLWFLDRTLFVRRIGLLPFGVAFQYRKRTVSVPWGRFTGRILTPLPGRYQFQAKAWVGLPYKTGPRGTFQRVAWLSRKSGVTILTRPEAQNWAIPEGIRHELSQTPLGRL